MTVSLEERVARAIWDAEKKYYNHRDMTRPVELTLKKARAAIAVVCPASIRESERAACEAIARGEKVDSDATNDECDEAYNMACDHIADAIAARRGKGEGI